MVSAKPINGSGHRAEPGEIWKARRFIRENLESALSLHEVAKSVNLSANYLSEKFKKITGVKFVDYVAAARVEKALALLVNMDLRISEIAFGVGFQSLSQFNRIFKRLVRQSPSEFRAARVGAWAETDFKRRFTTSNFR